MNRESLTIVKLAREAGINLETVRYYDRRGLLPKPPRTASGYRLFPGDAALRLRFIRRAQELGFPLKMIRELLALRVSPRTTSAEIRKRTEVKIADIEQKIKEPRIDAEITPEVDKLLCWMWADFGVPRS